MDDKKRIWIPEGVVYAEESYQIMGACFEVYNQIGSGFLEPVYQECLELELAARKIPFVAQRELNLTYRGIRLQRTYKVDIVCFDKIILELKAVSVLVDEHRAQLINYLHAAQLRLGLLINFGHHPKLEYQRLANESARE
jgi:GxxExxY protein